MPNSQPALFAEGAETKRREAGTSPAAGAVGRRAQSPPTVPAVRPWQISVCSAGGGQYAVVAIRMDGQHFRWGPYSFAHATAQATRLFRQFAKEGV